MISKLNKAARLFKFGRQVGFYDALPLARWVARNGHKLQFRSGGDVYLADSNLLLAKGHPLIPVVLNNVDLMDDLHRISNVNFSLNGNDLIANAGKIRAIVNNSCDIKTLHEMFVVQLYNFQLPGDLVFIDVGMNIGLASLFFHSMHEGYSYGFELIPDTFAAAEANLDLNVKVSMKHTSYPFGLLNCDSEFTLAVNPDDTVGNSLFHRAQQSDCQSDVAVRVKDAAVAVEEIYSKHPDSTFVLKLDTEGSEYEILDRLFEKDLLSRISLLLLELHPRDDRNPESIRSQLRSTNFCWNESIVPSNGCGLLYAYHRAGKGWLKSKSNGKAATCEN